METNDIKILIDKYYAGDILPEEYQSLLLALNDDNSLTPELENERRMLLAVESCEPVEPTGFEKRLIKAINQQNKRKHFLIRIAYSGAVAAILLICLTIGSHFQGNRETYKSDSMANVQLRHDRAAIVEATKVVDAVDTVQEVTTVPTVYSRPKVTSDKKLEKSIQVADEALMDVLASIHKAQDDVIETIDEIDISQTTDFNI